MNAPVALARRVGRALLTVAAAVLLGGCGVAYYEASYVVADPVHHDAGYGHGTGHAYDDGYGAAYLAPPLAGLTLHLTRIGPEAVQLDWSYDPVATSYDVARDGIWLAQVADPTLVDASGVIGAQYCYQVVGRDAWGVAVSTSSVGCLTLF
jgi:hypothetical protein